MNITVTNRITDLKPFKVHEDEEIKFQPTTKGRNVDIWFTGKNNQIRNIYFGHLKLVSMGMMNEVIEKAVVKMMKENKTDVLTDGVHYYTRASMGFCRITNLSDFITPSPALRLYENNS